MNTRRIVKPRILLVSVSSVVVLLSGVFFAWQYESHKPWQTSSTCGEYSGALYDPATPNSIKDFAGASRGVVIADVLNPDAYKGTQRLDGPPPRIRVTKVLKGSNVLHEGNVLSLCAGTGILSSDDNASAPIRTVLVFLEGREQSKNIWVPHQGYIGVIRQDKDGRFRPWASDGPTSVTASELQDLIK